MKHDNTGRSLIFTLQHGADAADMAKGFGGKVTCKHK